MDAAHAQRVVDIDREYAHDVAETSRRWADVEKKILELRQFMIEVEPGTDDKPKNPLVNDYLPKFDTCRGTPEAPTSDGVREACESAIRASFWQAFAARYYKADFAWIQKQREANPDVDIEQLATQSHNATGVCMQVVNEYGTPTYDMPDLDSVMPNTPSKASCSIGTSCPIGFRCDFGSGVCVR
jgi:hypothetical protein